MKRKRNCKTGTVGLGCHIKQHSCSRAGGSASFVAHSNLHLHCAVQRRSIAHIHLHEEKVLHHNVQQIRGVNPFHHRIPVRVKEPNVVIRKPLLEPACIDLKRDGLAQRSFEVAIACSNKIVDSDRIFKAELPIAVSIALHVRRTPAGHLVAAGRPRMQQRKRRPLYLKHTIQRHALVLCHLGQAPSLASTASDAQRYAAGFERLRTRTYRLRITIGVVEQLHCDAAQCRIASTQSREPQTKNGNSGFAAYDFALLDDRSSNHFVALLRNTCLQINSSLRTPNQMGDVGDNRLHICRVKLHTQTEGGQGAVARVYPHVRTEFVADTHVRDRHTGIRTDVHIPGGNRKQVTRQCEARLCYINPLCDTALRSHIYGRVVVVDKRCTSALRIDSHVVVRCCAE